MQLYGINKTMLPRPNVEQRFRFLSTPVWRHAPENTLDFPTVVMLREGSVPADSKNTQHLLLLTAEGTELSFRMTSTCFQFLVFVVLGSHQGHCCYCCKNQMLVVVCGTRKRRHSLGGVDGAAVDARVSHEGSV